MNWFINFFAIALIEIYVIDLSGAIPSLLHPVVRKLLNIKTGNIQIPLLECSLCVIFHTGWIYLLITGNFTAVNLLATTLISLYSKNLAGLLRWSTELLVKLENVLYDIFKI